MTETVVRTARAHSPVAPAYAPATRLDQARAPLAEALAAHLAAAPTSLSCPGHQGAAPGPAGVLGPATYAADVWLSASGVDLARTEAEALAAEAWGADRAFLLVNGSTSGNQAYLAAALCPGDEVVVARDVHTSVHAALVQTGARPVWVAPRVHEGLGVPMGLHPDDVAAALDAHPDARLVVAVSPGYWGVASDVRGLADTAHAHGVPLFVDEAWGAHLPFHPALPTDAMSAGADAAVTSAHKMLTALSQGALLLVRDRAVPVGRVASAVRMTQTTSPLLPLLASVDEARRFMALDGADRLGRALDVARDVRARLARLAGVRVLDAASLGLPDDRYDPLRVVVDVRGLGVTGVEAEAWLRGRYGLVPEGSDLHRVVFVVGPGAGADVADRLETALVRLVLDAPGAAAAGSPGGSVVHDLAALAYRPGVQALTPREAYDAEDEAVPLGAAAGRVCAELVTPYPPGIPVLAPGEVVDAGTVTALLRARAAGLHVHGPADPTLGMLRVVC